MGQITVAQFVAQQLASCGRSQKDIACDAGYPNPNIMTMIKRGQKKLPLGKIGPLAQAMGADPMHLFQLSMSEYHPETWAALESLFGKDAFLTEAERGLVELMRVYSAEQPLDMTDPQTVVALREAFSSVASRARATAQAAIDRYESAPSNKRFG